MTSLRAAALVPLLGIAITGCGDDCTRLADAVCARAGTETPQCRDLRSRADASTQDDRRACGKALLATELLTPKG
jgi:hypothetical protein